MKCWNLHSSSTPHVAIIATNIVGQQSKCQICIIVLVRNTIASSDSYVQHYRIYKCNLCLIYKHWRCSYTIEKSHRGKLSSSFTVILKCASWFLHILHTRLSATYIILGLSFMYVGDLMKCSLYTENVWMQS